MEETRKFVCKFCNRRFPSGKSLGGHIRTHMNQHSSNNNKAIADSGKIECNGVDAAARKKRKKRDLSSSDYGLRENPRKTKRFVHHHHPFSTLHHNKEKFCRECGKGFSSLKALCGHMACHSEKDQKQNFSMMDAQSDTETSDPEDLKRTRFMTLNNNNPTSASVSEVEQEEGVEVAMCLILLSKGFSSHNKGRFGLDKEYNSDNYSAGLEAKSNSVDARVGINDGQNNKVNIKDSVYNASELVKLGKDKMKLKFSDSGYSSRYGSKNEDSNVSIHGVFRNDVFNDYDDVFEPRKMMMNNSSRLHRSRNSTESKKLVVLGNSDKFDSFNSAKQEYLGHNLEDEVSRKKKKKNQTSFPNHDSEESYASAEKITDSSTDSDSFPYSYQKPKSSNKAKMKKVVKKSKKTKEHECPICNRTFRSGQALGGHKRSHFVGGFEENNTEIVKQESQSPSTSPAVIVPCLIDLNLPAPVDE